MKVILLLVLSLLPLNSALAAICRCGASQSESTPEQFAVAVTQAYDRAAAVISATVKAIEYRDLTENSSKDAARVKVIKLRVEKWWKGENSDEVILYTDEKIYANGTGSGNDCEYPFEVGKKYLVYAYLTEKKRMQTNYCSRTKLTENAEKEVAELEKSERDKRVKPGVRLNYQRWRNLTTASTRPE